MRRYLWVLLALAVLLTGCSAAEVAQTTAPAQETEQTEVATTEPHQEKTERKLTKIVRLGEFDDDVFVEELRYNDAGVLVEYQSGYMSDGEKYGPTLTYSPEGRLLWMIYGEPVDAYKPGENGGSGYEYNEAGQLVKLTQWEGGVVVTTYEYDEKGVCIRAVDELDVGVYTTTYSYDEDGVRVASKTTIEYSDYEEEGYTTTYDYTYKPFTLERCPEEDWAKLQFNIADHVTVYEIYLFEENQQIIQDAEGYVEKVISGDSVYYFYYDGQEPDPATWETEPTETEPAPTYAPATSYDQILDMYRESILCKWSNMDGEGYYEPADPDSVCYMLPHFHGDDTLEDVGYALQDLNGDGQQELLISRKEYANSGMLYQVYTIVDGKVVIVLSAGERDRFNLAEDGTFLNNGSGSAVTVNFINYRLTGDGKLQICTGVLYDEYEDRENPHFRYEEGIVYELDGSWDPKKTPITEDAFDAIIDGFPEAVPIVLTPLSQ